MKTAARAYVVALESVATIISKSCALQYSIGDSVEVVDRSFELWRQGLPQIEGSSSGSFEIWRNGLPVDAAKVLSTPGTIEVSANTGLKYEISQVTSSSTQLKYEISQIAASSTQLKYEILQQAFSSILLGYSVDEIIGLPFLGFTDRGNIVVNDYDSRGSGVISKEYTGAGELVQEFVEATTREIISTCSVKYNITQLVPSSRTIKYNISNIVSPAIGLKWNIFSSATRTNTIKYDVLQKAIRAITSKYNIYNAVSTGKQISYNISAPLSGSLELEYHIHQLASCAYTLSYHVIGPIVSSVSLRYDIGNSVERLLTVKYNISSRTSRDIEIRYELIGCAEGKVVLLYNLYAIEIARTDILWMGDTIPQGAEWIDEIGKSVSNTHRLGNTSIRVSATNGYVEPGFLGASSPAYGYIIIWCYIPRDEVPDGIWFSFHDGSSWEHRVFYGANLCPHGVLGTGSRRYIEDLPTPGTWTPLIIHVSDMEISRVTGVRFGVAKVNGQGSLLIDGIYYTDQPVYAIPQPHVGLRNSLTYRIYRNLSPIAETGDLTYFDPEAIDRNLNQRVSAPLYTFSPNEEAGTLLIEWTSPPGGATTYAYAIESIDENGIPSSRLEGEAIVSNDYARVEITISSEHTEEFTVSCEGTSYTQGNIIYGETYHYTFRTYNLQNELTSTYFCDYTPYAPAPLDLFVLDLSILV